MKHKEKRPEETPATSVAESGLTQLIQTEFFAKLRERGDIEKGVIDELQELAEKGELSDTAKIQTILRTKQGDKG